jgi:hypothetical protein
MPIPYEYTSQGLAAWKQWILERHPTAKFCNAPEGEGGTIDAFVGDSWVGDWDGYEAPYGRRLTQ